MSLGLVLSACAVGPKCGCPSKTAVVTVEAGRPTPRSFMVKVKPGESCPAAPAGWTAKTMPTIEAAGLNALMSQYCEYVFDGVGLPAALPTFDDPTNIIMAAVADYAAVLPQVTLQNLHENFSKHIGAEFKDGATNVATNHRPWVAIIDTADNDSATTLDREIHGLAMAGIVNTIRCPTGSNGCEGDGVMFENAFPRSLSSSVGADADTEVRGTVGSLNQALLRAIERWQTNPDGRGAGRPLILNMSLGWEWHWSEHTNILALPVEGDSGEEPPPPSLLAQITSGGATSLTPSEEALWLTLAWASCQDDVLSIAATGNTRGGACDEAERETMAPAAWEDLPRLMPSDCDSLLNAPAGSTGHALVYGAGGVDANGSSIVNARSGSKPKRVLYSSMVPSPGGGPGGVALTPPWTGTSVAAASLSAIVAQYWGMQTSLPASGIIPNIDNRQSKYPMVNLWDIGAGMVPPVPLIRAYDVLDTLYKSSSPPLSNQSQNPNQTCPGRSVEVHPQGTPLPSGVLFPELNPQPQVPVCPTCTLDLPQAGPNSTPSLDIELDLQGHTLDGTQSQSVVLELHRPAGEITSFNLDLQFDLTDCDTPPPLQQRPSKCKVNLANIPGGANFVSIATAAPDVIGARLFFYVDTRTGTANPEVQLTGNEILVTHN